MDQVREDLALMVSGIPVPVKIREYAATMQELKTREEIFSAMVVYGFLSYEKWHGFYSQPGADGQIRGNADQGAFHGVCVSSGKGV